MNSRAIRQFAKNGAGRFLFDNKYYRYLRSSRNYLLTWVLYLRNPTLFEQVKTYCTFIGHMKSGGSMLSSMLDAHPNAVFSDEAGALDYFSLGFQKNQLFHVILRNSKAESAKGKITARRLGGYSWAVNGQWQGRHQTIKVVGDSTTGASTRNLASNPVLLQKIHGSMPGVNVKFIHVIRNPFDPIAASMIRGRRTFEDAFENYFSSCQFLSSLRNRISPSDVFSVHYEDFVSEPRSKLEEICNFLGLETTDEYLNACAQVIHTSDDTRSMVQWKTEWINAVHAQIATYDFLQGYTFDAKPS